MPEAVVYINGKRYNAGRLHGQKVKAYLLPEWLDTSTKGVTVATNGDSERIIPLA